MKHSNNLLKLFLLLGILANFNFALKLESINPHSRYSQQDLDLLPKFRPFNPNYRELLDIAYPKPKLHLEKGINFNFKQKDIYKPETGRLISEIIKELNFNR